MANIVIELWKNIIDFPSYDVSTLGNVRNVKKGRLMKSQKDKDGYVVIGLYNQKKYKMSKVHRLVAEAFIPNPDNKPVIDHRDGNRANNDVSNLRWATISENTHHRIKKSDTKYSKYVGVRPEGGLWRAVINHKTKYITIGYYNTEVEAAQAYDEQARELFGEFAVINIPEN